MVIGNPRACAFTGHRPPRCGFDPRYESSHLLKLREAVSRELFLLWTEGVETLLFGMAVGADQLAAEQALRMRDMGVPFHVTCVLPCKGQDSSWPKRARQQYLSILERADHVITLAESYSAGCMHIRNRFMVDHAATLLSIYDGNKGGGTAYTVAYAKKNGKRIIVLHPNRLEVSRCDPSSELPLQQNLFISGC